MEDDRCAVGPPHRVDLVRPPARLPQLDPPAVGAEGPLALAAVIAAVAALGVWLAGLRRRRLPPDRRLAGALHLDVETTAVAFRAAVGGPLDRRAP